MQKSLVSAHVLKQDKVSVSSLNSSSSLDYSPPPPPQTPFFFFCYETWCVFFLAPRSVSSVPLHHYRSTARLSPTPRGMQTHIKRGPAAHFEDFQALLFLLSSFLSFSQCDPHAGRLSFLAAHTHTRTHTPTAVPHSAHLAATVELDR